MKNENKAPSNKEIKNSFDNYIKTYQKSHKNDLPARWQLKDFVVETYGKNEEIINVFANLLRKQISEMHLNFFKEKGDDTLGLFYKGGQKRKPERLLIDQRQEWARLDEQSVRWRAEFFANAIRIRNGWQASIAGLETYLFTEIEKVFPDGFLEKKAIFRQAFWRECYKFFCFDYYLELEKDAAQKAYNLIKNRSVKNAFDVRNFTKTFYPGDFRAQKIFMSTFRRVFQSEYTYLNKRQIENLAKKQIDILDEKQVFFNNQVNDFIREFRKNFADKESSKIFFKTLHPLLYVRRRSGCKGLWRAPKTLTAWQRLKAENPDEFWARMAISDQELNVVQNIAKRDKALSNQEKNRLGWVNFYMKSKSDLLQKTQELKVLMKNSPVEKIVAYHQGLIAQNVSFS